MESPARRPAVWPAFVTFGVAVAVLSFGSGAVIAVAYALLAVRHALPAHARPDDVLRAVMSARGVMLASGLASVSATFFTALIAARIETRSVSQRLRLQHRPRWIAVGVLGALAVIAIGQTMDAIAWVTGAYALSSLKALDDAIISISPWEFAAFAFVASVGAGLGEESLFRGAIQTRLVARWGRWPGIVIAAALFGLMHGDFVHSPMAFVMGLVLGWIAEAHGGIRATILAHVLNNATAFVTSRFLPSHTLPDSQQLALGAATFVVFLGCMAAIARLAKAPAPPAIDALLPPAPTDSATATESAPVPSP